MVGLDVANPTKPTEVALVLKGRKGSGKGIVLGGVFGRIFATHALQVSDRSQIVGKFNQSFAVVLFSIWRRGVVAGA